MAEPPERWNTLDNFQCRPSEINIIKIRQAVWESKHAGN
jgi:hypothetical protein